MAKDANLEFFIHDPWKKFAKSGRVSVTWPLIFWRVFFKFIDFELYELSYASYLWNSAEALDRLRVRLNMYFVVHKNN